MIFTSGTRAGMRAQASCVIQEGDRPLKMAWQKNGQPLDIEKGSVWISQIDTLSSILVIERAEAKHSGNYSCLATNAAKTSSTTAELIVSGRSLFNLTSNVRVNIYLTLLGQT